MRRACVLAVCSALTFGGLAALGSSAPVAADPDPDHPVHDVTITGTRVTTWPAYDADVDRFAIAGDTVLPWEEDPRTGSVTVAASTTDPDGRITVDGVPLTQPSTEVTGLEVGDEVSVQITDADGTSNQSWIYLPAHFPRVSVDVDDREHAAPGDVFTGFQSFVDTHGSMSVLDHRGVPRYVRDGLGVDLKPSPVDPTHYSVARNPYGESGFQVDELDEQFRVVASHVLDGIPGSTDSHDSELLPDGRALLMGYHPRADGSFIDAVIQVVGADGRADFTWTTKGRIDPSEAYVAPAGDYAHINSLQMLANGDVLASFRNLSTIMRIATTYHDGYDPGDIVWRLGGAHNQFDLSGDPLGGPCAQHMARLLSPTRLVFFDNGSHDEGGYLGGQTADMCPDPSDPEGPRVARPVTRVVEYAIDQDARTASEVWSYDAPPRYASFAGDAQRLANGNTMIGWSFPTDCTGRAHGETCPAASPQPAAEEVTAAGDVVWRMSTPGWITYRATKHAAPDAIAPTVAVTGGPADGATYDAGAAVPALTYRCTDQGGSSLQSCTASVGYGAAPPATPGTHSVTVTATDGAGNTTSRTRTYRVSAPPVATVLRPDAQVRAPGGPWRGAGRTGTAAAQAVALRLRPSGSRRTAVVEVRVRNAGTVADRVTLRGQRSGGGLQVRYRVAGRDVTARVVGGRLVSPVLAPGATYTVRMAVTRSAGTPAGRQRRISVVATSVGEPARRDAVSALVRTVR